jgi:Icc-related predicted phosphoesterase
MKILTVSDKVNELIYSPAIKHLFGDVDLVLGCGDLPLHYLEFIVTMLGGPLFYVVGNHANAVKQLHRPKQEWQYPGGCENIDGRVVRYRGLLLAGLEGSMRYNNQEYFQYTDQEMARKAWGLVPGLMLNKLLYGRYLDILITHAPPKGVHDRPDLCHQGFRSFLTLMDRFKPRYLIHGHIHLYGPNQTTESVYAQTRVINTYSYRILEIDDDSLDQQPSGRKEPAPTPLGED